MAKKAKNSQIIAPEITLGHLERLARLIRQVGHAGGFYPVQWEALRYLARANEFSNSPGALAKFMGATKGTISQTVLALVKKGLVAKGGRAADSRSVTLTLTEQGKTLLEEDPLFGLEQSFAGLSEKTRKRFSKGLSEILKAELVRQNEPSFGSCTSCRYYRDGGVSEPDECMHFNVRLQPNTIKLICVQHVAAN